MKARYDEVIVLADEPLTERDREIASRRFALTAGGFTAANRAASKVRWVVCCLDFTVDQMAELAGMELRCARQDNPTLKASAVMFIVWKKDPKSIHGASLTEIANAILDATFTAEDVKSAEEKRRPSAYSDSYKDDDGPEPADWWKEKK